MEIALASTDPLEVLDYMREHPVHLILTDISMPQMMGTELIRKAREINPSVYILVLSAYDTFDYVRSAMRGGAENYLLKPLDPDELSESISTIVRHLEDRNTISNNFGPSTLTLRRKLVQRQHRGR
jgi:YesN/AraC family two-component response regulator